MEDSQDHKPEIVSIRNSLIDVLTKLENDEISAKEANVVRRESNKRLKAILKKLKQEQTEDSEKGEETL